MPDPKSPKTILSHTLWCLKLIFNSNRVIFIAIIIFQVLASVFPLLRNRVFSQLIDSLIYPGQNNGLWSNWFFVFIAILIFSSFTFYTQSQLSRIQDIRLQAYLRKMFLDKVSQLDYQHLEGQTTSNLISKVDEEFGWRIRQTASDINNLFINVISLIAVTIILLPKFPLIWAVIFIGQIPQYFIEKFWVQKSWQLHEQNSENNKFIWDINYQLRTKNYIAELRINNAVKYLFNKFAAAFDSFANNRVGLITRQIPSQLGLTIFSTAVNAYCLFILLSSTHSGLITIGLFTFYFQIVTQTGDYFRGLVFSSVSITENSYHIGNFRTIMNLKNHIVGGSAQIPGVSPPIIEFKNVSFKYPNGHKFIYKNLNLTITSGEEIAVVGQNGAGKSTLIKLICHFYEPTEGDIFINGVNLKDISLENWNEKLSYLAQEFNHYGNLNLRDSVNLGKPEIHDDKQIISALKKADAKFVEKYKNGLDTLMSQRYGGEEPSWGQMQKIAIARVFYRNSPVIILDEPTASIDAISESKIFDQLYRDIKGNTLIIVSHRFSTVRNAKRIIVIDKGKIVEQGTHDQLIAHRGLYAKSFNLQAKGYN